MELSEIALQKLLQLFPEISNYIVNFKDVTEEAGKEESGLQIGIFILQFGEEFYYVPVIAKNDTVLPIDSLFNAETGMFMPLSRTYLDKIISSSQVYLGKRTKVPTTVAQNPSVYEMVTPPRTGKFVYASSSRLVEFLALMPSMVKKAMVEKFSEDKEVYNSLHRMFGLENLLAALKPVEAIRVHSKPAVEIVDRGENLSDDAISQILDRGYTVLGENKTNRIAVVANDASQLGPLKQVNGADIGADYDAVTRSGEIQSVYLPKRIIAGAQRPALLTFTPTTTSSQRDQSMFMMFADGNYAVGTNIVARGEADTSKKVLKDFFSMVLPMTPRDVTTLSKIAVFTPSLDLVGAYNIHNVVEAPHGITMEGYSLLPGERRVVINAYRNCKSIDITDATNIFIPINTLIAPLGDNKSDELEVNINAALAKLELNTLTALGTSADMGFDGVEFTYNGKPIGNEMKIIEILVGKEGIAPEKADSFVKQAKECGKVKIYMSKKADFEPAEIPQYGEQPLDQSQFNTFGTDQDGAFANNLRSSVDTQDPQVVESMVISELLQATDMNTLVREYLPEIEGAVDKLGRTLLLARLNMDKLAASQNSNEVMSFIANLRNVYRLLGDNVTKLERMASGPEQAQAEAGSGE